MILRSVLGDSINISVEAKAPHVHLNNNINNQTIIMAARRRSRSFTAEALKNLFHTSGYSKTGTAEDLMCEQGRSRYTILVL
jgi:hypothetical protein